MERKEELIGGIPGLWKRDEELIRESKVKGRGKTD